MIRSIGVCAVIACAAGSAVAAIDVMNPTQQALGAFSSQNTQSSFGGGNILAGAYASISGGQLDLLVTGRIGTGNERVVIFVDNLGGGGAASVPGGLFGLGGNTAGMTFDTAFRPQTVIVANGNGTDLFVDFNSNLGGTPSSVFAGLGARGNGGTPLAFAGPGAPDIRASFNDAFSGGVFGFNSLAAGDLATYAAATTGMGFRIPLAALGVPSDLSAFNVMVMILGGNGETISNQILGPANGFAPMFPAYPVASSLDLRQIDGNQFFQIPTPGAATLLGLGGLALARRRR